MHFAYDGFVSEENPTTELLTETLQLKVSPTQEAEIKAAAKATRMKRPELVRQALRRGIPILLAALGVEMPPEKHGAEHLPMPASN